MITSPGASETTATAKDIKKQNNIDIKAWIIKNYAPVKPQSFFKKFVSLFKNKEKSATINFQKEKGLLVTGKIDDFTKIKVLQEQLIEKLKNIENKAKTEEGTITIVSSDKKADNENIVIINPGNNNGGIINAPVPCPDPPVPAAVCYCHTMNSSTASGAAVGMCIRTISAFLEVL